MSEVSKVIIGNEVVLDLTGDTVTADQVTAGATFHSADGAQHTGTNTADSDTQDAICINEQGGYQFRLFPGGEENPLLYTDGWVPLYKWDGQEVQKRTEEEIAEDWAEAWEKMPSETEQLRADVDFLAALQGVIL